MSPDDIRMCMSLGYSQKNSNTTIGQYGNGFKTSVMRLGADVIVFTRQPNNKGFVTQSAGLLSYTFLIKTGHEDIVVPMVDFKLRLDGTELSANLRTNMDDWISNLGTILRWSPFSSEHELLKQFDDIGKHGTKVVVYNLWLNNDENLELDFDTDERDIQLRVGTEEKSKQPKLNALLVKEHISNQYQISLRVYSSILYLHMPENFRIILRGKTVQHHSIAVDLKHTQYIAYKPQIGSGKDSNVKDVTVITTIGFTKEAPFVNVHGFNVYHKNRLIMVLWRQTSWSLHMMYMMSFHVHYIHVHYITLHMSPENGVSLHDILEQNTILLQKCTDYEIREKHWRLKLMLHEQREQEQDSKIASLEKQLMEHKPKCVIMLEIPDGSGQKT
ncbi:protein MICRORCHIDIA 6 isoform X2 [Physcomitrium patens]